MGDRARWRGVLVLAPIAAKYWQIFIPSEYYEKLKKRYSSWAFAMQPRGDARVVLEDGSGILGCNGEGGSSPLLLLYQATMKQAGGPPHGRYGTNASRSCTRP